LPGDWQSFVCGMAAPKIAPSDSPTFRPKKKETKRLPLENPRYELFSQLIAKGRPQGQAYLDAGFRAANAGSMKANASRLLARADVQERVQELLDASATEAKIDGARVIKMLLEDRTTALDNKQTAAAVRVDELLGKTLGLFIDRREIQYSPFDDWNYQELEKFRDVLRAEQGRRATLAAASSSEDLDSER
jgi:hypothetical protein